ncbi:MAG TPA: DMT family transporter [bacterium]|nr:DMT family transporter [bacterium]HQG44510.1 DMT family transporter [bacterium]HQI48074.1 DMT family transporter [bacterium]HQJ63308.1 DMT family transporter [bacterium]
MGDRLRLVVIGAGLVSISLASVLIKLCPAPPFTISSYRLFIAAVIYLLFACLRGRPVWEAFTPSGRRWALLSGLFLGIHFLSWISSLRYTSVAVSVILVQTFPVFVVIGSWLFLQEQPSRRTAVGMILALAGGVVITLEAGRSGEIRLAGNLLALTGALGAAGYYLIGRKLRSAVDTVPYVGFVYSVAAAVALTATLGSGAPMAGFALRTWLLLIAIALLPQVIGHTSLNWALKHYSATTVSILTLAEPLGATILAFLILHEKVGSLTLFGGLIILAGVALTLLAEHGRSGGRGKVA